MRILTLSLLSLLLTTFKVYAQADYCIKAKDSAEDFFDALEVWDGKLKDHPEMGKISGIPQIEFTRDIIFGVKTNKSGQFEKEIQKFKSVKVSKSCTINFALKSWDSSADPIALLKYTNWNFGGKIKNFSWVTNPDNGHLVASLSDKGRDFSLGLDVAPSCKAHEIATGLKEHGVLFKVMARKNDRNCQKNSNKDLPVYQNENKNQKILANDSSRSAKEILEHEMRYQGDIPTVKVIRK